MSLNKWLGIGNVTKDAQLKQTSGGVSVCNFSIACNERYKDRDGNQKEKTEFINFVAFDNLAGICAKFLVKGKQVYLEGRLQTRSYDDSNGVKKYVTEIVVEKMQLLGGGGRKEDAPGAGGGNYQPQSSSDNANFDDDCPF